jgi:hypothetical protein
MVARIALSIPHPGPRFPSHTPALDLRFPFPDREQTKEHRPRPAGPPGVAAADNRLFVAADPYVDRAGIPGIPGPPRQSVRHPDHRLTSPRPPAGTDAPRQHGGQLPGPRPGGVHRGDGALPRTSQVLPSSHLQNRAVLTAPGCSRSVWALQISRLTALENQRWPLERWNTASFASSASSALPTVPANSATLPCVHPGHHRPRDNGLPGVRHLRSLTVPRCGVNGPAASVCVVVNAPTALLCTGAGPVAPSVHAGYQGNLLCVLKYTLSHICAGEVSRSFRNRLPVNRRSETNAPKRARIASGATSRVR